MKLSFVREELDFLIDCEQQKLVPRDPKQIVSEVESAKSEISARIQSRFSGVLPISVDVH